MKMTFSLIAICLFLLPGLAQSQITIIPTPVKMEVASGSFMITPQTYIYASDATRHEADMLNAYLGQIYGFTLPIQTNPSSGNGINLSLREGEKNPEAYHLTVNKSKVDIYASDNRGVFMGIQTLLQLIPPQKVGMAAVFQIMVPAVTIYDYPQFGYRGMHLDVCRHFFSVAFVKKYIDYIAMQKFNTFHWHLTEDQGWRIEIKKYPKLTEIGAWRNGTTIGRYPGTGNDGIHYGGYYTQEEIRDVVRYASDRHITIIPEIELPGHASAAIAAYPELSCFPDESTKAPARTTMAGPTTGKQVQQTWGVFPDVFCPKETTFKFLEDVLDEVLELFPSKFIHIGGDECPKDNWKRCAHCQQLIKEKGLKDEHGLQSYFIHTIEKYLNGKGRNIIGWDEILEGGLAPNATVMSWRGEEGGIEAASQNHTVIMTPGQYMYFDHTQTKQEDSVTIGGYTSLNKVYTYQPVPQKLDSSKRKYVLGAQANVWTEYMGYPSKVEYMIFPRMSALSEVLWTPENRKSWDRFKSSLPDIYKRYNLWGANYFKHSEEVMKAEGK
ncbi:MAG TPA: beta-N-acetylhexosaminidase [Ginsengibacter sp.]|nr:beta-N-acetylhexosaminidase [Ginsengibacter sp.]HRP44037.1 beta-N-acetylhexosaminidase [Ginsengibacter sp.]